MAKIKAATVSVTLEAESAKFTQALQRAQNQAHNSTNSIIKALANAQAASAQWANATTKAFFAPFKAFQKAIAPFKTMVNQVIAIASNLTHPFRQLVAYVSGPFVRGFKTAFDAAKRVLTGFGVAATAAGAALGFIMHDVAQQTMELAKWSASLGISVQTLNKVSYASRIFGMSIEDVGDSMSTLQEKIAETAEAGGGLEDFFNRISAKKGPKAFIDVANEWNKLKPDEQLNRYMEELDKMNTNTAVKFAKEISDQFAEMVALTKMSGQSFKDLQAEAERFGSSAVSAEGFIKLTAAWGKVKFEAFNVFNAVGDRLAQPLADLIGVLQDDFNAWVRGFGDKNDTLAESFTKMTKSVTVSIIDAVQSAMQAMSDFWDTVMQAWDGLKNILQEYGGIQFKQTLSVQGQIAATPEQKLNLKKQDQMIAALEDIKNGKGSITYDLEQQSRSLGVAPERAYGGFSMFDTTKADELQKAIIDKRNAEIKAIEDSIKAQNGNSSAGQKAIQYLEKLKENVLKTSDATGDFGRRTSDSTKGLTSAQRDAADAAKETAKKQKEASDNLAQALKSLANVRASLGLGGQTGWQMKVAADQQSLIDQYTASIKAATEAHNKEQVAKLKVAQQNDLETLKSQQAVKYWEEFSDMSKKEQLNFIKLREQLGMSDKVGFDRPIISTQGPMAFRNLGWKQGVSTDSPEQLKFKIETEDGRQAIRDYFDELKRNNEEYYTRDRAALDQLNRDKLEMIAAYEAERRRLREEADATSDATGPLAEFYNGLNQKEGALANHQSVIEGYSNEEIQTAMKTEKGKRDIMLQTGGQLLGEAAKTNKKAFEMQKALNIANAIMNTAQGVTRAIAEGGPYAGPALAAMIGALGMIQIQQIRSQQFVGQFHDGIDSLPSTGTYIGEKGERVLSVKTNEDLKSFMADQSTSRNETSYAPVYNINSAPTADDIEAILKKDKMRFRRAIM
ncbi:hypothetical protein [Aeromonas caviae]|uniref:hypothetical protein n=1 Tax=Aeromonas caviae TaxID=648 RepID=UPI00224D3F2E|nr:hypothetical protein [Aeromonas caviae]MCX4071930.1 hypothetical protein [Aeromonas caviae]